MLEYQKDEKENKEANKRDFNKTRRRAGRTVLIKSNQEYECNFNGITNTANTENGSKFVIFDTIENAKHAFKSLKDNNVKAKYSYYKMFFKINTDLIEDNSYDELKASILKEILSFNEEVNILYFKLYTRQGKLTGSGDLVLDTKDDLDKLVSKKNLKLNDNGMEIRMFRFIIKNRNDEQVETTK